SHSAICSAVTSSSMPGQRRHRESVTRSPAVVQGTPSTLTSPSSTVENRADYGPTGNVRAGTRTTVDQTIGCTSAYLDTTGCKIGARSYDRTTNRATQVDFSGQEAYLYTVGVPVNRQTPPGSSAFRMGQAHLTRRHSRRVFLAAIVTVLSPQRSESL
ncbi:hypothetical protein, partial [Streptomyces fagopyri]